MGQETETEQQPPSITVDEITTPITDFPEDIQKLVVAHQVFTGDLRKAELDVVRNQAAVSAMADSTIAAIREHRNPKVTDDMPEATPASPLS